VGGTLIVDGSIDANGGNGSHGTVTGGGAGGLDLHSCGLEVGGRLSCWGDPAAPAVTDAP
jgi:hypothetical protein